MAQIKIPQSTTKQQDYIEQLSIDLQLGRRARNLHISSIANRKIAYLDELTCGEASNVIEILKHWRDNNVVPQLAEQED